MAGLFRFFQLRGSEAEEASEQIRKLVPNVKSGTLRFFGDWFGRPYDNVHRIVQSQASSNILQIVFNGGETLIVNNPSGVHISGNIFTICEASVVRWEWHGYGRPKVPENRYFMQYVQNSGVICGSTNVDWYRHEFSVNPEAPAVEIV